MSAVESHLILLLSFVEGYGAFTPIIFIIFHVLRQFLFIPVTAVCLLGGMLFGSILGSLYSFIGLLLLSTSFYFLIHNMPKTAKKLSQTKEKWLGNHMSLTVGQIAIMRLIPFFHYQLLNFCLMERKPGYGAFIRGSMVTNIPLALIYTVFGRFILTFTAPVIAIVLTILVMFIYLFREKYQVLTWREFFS